MFTYLRLKKFKLVEFNMLQDLSRNQIYEYYSNYFKFKSSKVVKNHRKYFKLDNRGFGEDAFHSFWEDLMQNFKPKNILEIGVYRGQSISLFTLLSKIYHLDCEVWGLSPLNSSADKVSNYDEIEYRADINKHYKYFNLGKPNLFESYSNNSKMGFNLY